MDKDPEPRRWLQTLPGVLTGLAAFIGAVTTLVVALGGKDLITSSGQKKPLASASVQTTLTDGCTPPHVWRLAVPSDHVCVNEDSRKRVELENLRAAERRAAGGRGAYGADTCVTGYVWREAFTGDTVCVLPERRDEVRQENATAAQRVQR